eukprot:364335-Chlamydomonas_euryale.AAC.1
MQHHHAAGRRPRSSAGSPGTASLVAPAVPSPPAFLPRGYTSALGFMQAQPQQQPQHHVQIRQDRPASGASHASGGGVGMGGGAGASAGGGSVSRPESGRDGPDLRLFSKAYMGQSNFQLTDLEED